MIRRDAFTMVELVFVIVILGVLSAVAIPRLAASRDDANIAKFKSDISAIRSSIATARAQKLMSGNSSFPDTNKTTLSSSSNFIFDNILDYPIKQAGVKDTGWRFDKMDGNITKFILRIENTDISFDYNKTNGVFTCVDKNSGSAKNLCETLVY